MDHSDDVFYYQISTQTVNSTALPLLIFPFIKKAKNTVTHIRLFPMKPSAQDQSKKGGKDQETIKSRTTSDPRYHMGKLQKYNKHHQQEPRGQPFPIR